MITERESESSWRWRYKEWIDHLRFFVSLSGILRNLWWGVHCKFWWNACGLVERRLFFCKDLKRFLVKPWYRIDFDRWRKSSSSQLAFINSSHPHIWLDFFIHWWLWVSSSLISRLLSFYHTIRHASSHVLLKGFFAKPARGQYSHRRIPLRQRRCPCTNTILFPHKSQLRYPSYTPCSDLWLAYCSTHRIHVVPFLGETHLWQSHKRYAHQSGARSGLVRSARSCACIFYRDDVFGAAIWTGRRSVAFEIRGNCSQYLDGMATVPTI